MLPFTLNLDGLWLCQPREHGRSNAHMTPKAGSKKTCTLLLMSWNILSSEASHQATLYRTRPWPRLMERQCVSLYSTVPARPSLQVTHPRAQSYDLDTSRAFQPLATCSSQMRPQTTSSRDRLWTVSCPNS